jgi:hypothetical protein
MNLPTVPPELENEVRRVLSDSRMARVIAEQVFWRVLSRLIAKVPPNK